MTAVTKPKIIAEIAQAHDGSLGQAFAFIDAVAETDADAIKFQCHMADEESTHLEKFRPGGFFPQDPTRQHYWRRTAFTWDQWRKLAEHAGNCGLEFGLSFFCSKAARELATLCDFVKVPSGETDNPHLIGELRRIQHQPIYWSLGMSGILDCPEDLIPRVIPLYCVPQYPATPQQMDLERVNRHVGLSDHSGYIWPGVIAAFNRAPAIEVHVCWHKEQFGPDTASSLTVDQLRELVDAVRWVSWIGESPHGLEDRRRAKERYLQGRNTA